MEKINIIIPVRMSGERIDVALSEMLPGYSRSKITAWIKSGDALINENFLSLRINLMVLRWFA